MASNGGNTKSRIKSAVSTCLLQHEEQYAYLQIPLIHFISIRLPSVSLLGLPNIESKQYRRDQHVYREASDVATRTSVGLVAKGRCMGSVEMRVVEDARRRGLEVSRDWLHHPACGNSKSQVEKTRGQSDRDRGCRACEDTSARGESRSAFILQR